MTGSQAEILERSKPVTANPPTLGMPKDSTGKKKYPSLSRPPSLENSLVEVTPFSPASANRCSWYGSREWSETSVQKSNAESVYKDVVQIY